MTELSLELDTLKQSIGKTEQTSNVIDARSVEQMQSIIGLPQAPMIGDALPNLWHWMYTLQLAPAPLNELNYDGHPKLGGFLPPVALPRRMWAGGRLTFLKPLIIGKTMERQSVINNVALKHGRSGALCFVTVGHQFSCQGAVCIEEEHDMVYRDNPAADAKGPEYPVPVHQASWSNQITPSPVTLFRYSAVTFNGHRIHYDRDFCYREGYPGLVVHGPLTATLLMKLAESQNTEKSASQFNFKAIAPLFDTAVFTLNGCINEMGTGAHLWASNPDGRLALSAEATFLEA